MEHDREKRDIEKILKLNPDAPVPVIKDYCKSPVDAVRFEKIYGKAPETLSEMDSHLAKLKARIQFKSIKMYQEDVITQKEIDAKRNEKPIEIKDKMGRVIERKL